MIKSPLRYPGGKSRAVNFISRYIPEFQEFREPFLGGGSLFVYLKQKHSDRKFWINDIYKNLYLFWLKVQEEPEELLNKINELKVKYDDGKELHSYLLGKMIEFNDLEKAAGFFAMNRITFSGTSESGGYSNAAFEKRFTLSSIERVRDLALILGKTIITNLDYEEVVRREGEDVFIFLDPPYYSATKSSLYGKNGDLHRGFDHERFARVISEVEHKWLITYDDSQYIRNLFSFAHIKPWNISYGMRNVNKENDNIGKELLISNYSLNEFEEDSPELFDNQLLVKYGS